jgi:two-component system sensor histidine kinase DegS
LVFALRGYLQGFGKRSGLRIKLDADPSLEQARLPQELETNLFRIVQESLTNIKQHSGSPTAAISLKRRDHEIALEIRDKGHGIKGAVAKAVAKGDVTSLGVGLSGMRSAVEALRQHKPYFSPKLLERWRRRRARSSERRNSMYL